MDRRAFYHLYVNLNSLIELGMQRRAAQLLASLPDEPPASELTEDEARARMLKQFESLDLSAMDQVWERLRDTPIDYEQIAKDVAAQPSPEREPEAPAPVESGVSGDFDLPDLEEYMRRAYTHEEVLRERIVRLFAKADLTIMSRQLTELGGAQAPLTGELTGAQMEEWLVRDAADDAVLTSLATEMRRLEMAG